MVEAVLLIIIFALLVKIYVLKKICRLLKMKLKQNGQMPTKKEIEEFVRNKKL